MAEEGFDLWRLMGVLEAQKEEVLVFCVRLGVKATGTLGKCLFCPYLQLLIAVVSLPFN